MSVQRPVRCNNRPFGNRVAARAVPSPDSVEWEDRPVKFPAGVCGAASDAAPVGAVVRPVKHAHIVANVTWDVVLVWVPVAVDGDAAPVYKWGVDVALA